MIIRLDFEQIEEYIDSIGQFVEDLEEYIDFLEKKIEEIVDIGEGEFFKALEEETETRVNNIKKIIEYKEEFKTKMEDFLEEYREYDEIIGVYSVELEEVEERKEEIRNFLDSINYLEPDEAFENFINESIII